MNKYLVTAAQGVTFYPGMLLGLTKAQADRRVGLVEKVKGGYRVIRPVMFKCGETVTADPDMVNKTMLKQLGGGKATKSAPSPVTAPADEAEGNDPPEAEGPDGEESEDESPPAE